MGNSGLDGAISPTGMAFLEGEGAISPDTAKKPTPYSLGWARGFLSLLPLDASVHQTQSRMSFYLKMYLNLLADRIHVTSDRLHEREISSPCIQLEVNEVQA